MITVLEYGILSGHVYHPPLKDYLHTAIYRRSLSKLSKPISQDGWYRITDIDRRMTPTRPFYAAMYMKFCNGLVKSIARYY